MIVSHSAFIGFVTAMVILICTFSGVRDSLVLVRLLRRGIKTPHDRDLRFGVIVGIVVAALGFAGAINYYYG